MNKILLGKKEFTKKKKIIKDFMNIIFQGVPTNSILILETFIIRKSIFAKKKNIKKKIILFHFFYSEILIQSLLRKSIFLDKRALTKLILILF